MVNFALQPEGPPQIVGPGYMKKEVNVDETVNLSCSARGSPSPTIVWTTSDGQVPVKRTLLAPIHLLSAWGPTQVSALLLNIQVLKAVPPQETGDNVHSSVQFTITADVTAFCNVSNEYGADTVTFDIKTSEFPVSGRTCSSPRVHPSPETSFSSVPGLVQRLFMF